MVYYMSYFLCMSSITINNPTSTLTLYTHLRIISVRSHTMCACLQLYDRAEYVGGEFRTWKSRKHIKHDDTQLVIESLPRAAGTMSLVHVRFRKPRSSTLTHSTNYPLDIREKVVPRHRPEPVGAVRLSISGNPRSYRDRTIQDSKDRSRSK
jgi:hypothetical protein